MLDEVFVDQLIGEKNKAARKFWKRAFGGRKDPQKLSADDIKDLGIEADLEGPLVDYAKKGHKVEYLGTEDVDGTAAHKLRVTYATGNEAVVRERSAS